MICALYMVARVLNLEQKPLSNVHIVLVETSHPANIGSVARAMKTMGLHNLSLVNPKVFPAPEADALASGACDILKSAVVYPDLKQAIADYQLIFGTSARGRTLSIPSEDVALFAKNTLRHSDKKVAILFGRERTGLTNEELSVCNAQIHIPTNPEYGSLNIAQAVQIVCYELSRALTAFPVIGSSKKSMRDTKASGNEVNALIELIQDKLSQNGYLNDKSPKRTMQRIQRLFNKADMTTSEVKIMCGVIKNLAQSEFRKGL